MTDAHASRRRPAAIVLLHGFTQSGSSWDGVRRALGGRRGVFAPDLPGHGAMARRRPATFDACAAYLRALPEDRFVLGGYSLGGRVALHAALALGPRVTRLVLVGAGPGIADAAERAQRAAEDEALAARILAEGVEAFAARWAALPLFAGQPRGVAQAAQAERLRQDADGLAAALRGLGTGVMPPLWDRLDELALPVTLVVGERDEKYRAIAAKMAERLPDGRVEIVPGAGHAVHLERPHAVAAALLGAPAPP